MNVRMTLRCDRCGQTESLLINLILAVFERTTGIRADRLLDDSVPKALDALPAPSKPECWSSDGLALVAVLVQEHLGEVTHRVPPSVELQTVPRHRRLAAIDVPSLVIPKLERLARL